MRPVSAAVRTGRGTGVRELDGVTRRYGETLALDELSLTARSGTLCGFVGLKGRREDDHDPHRWPELLVLDEPFSGLNPVGVDVLVAAGEVKELRRRAGWRSGWPPAT